MGNQQIADANDLFACAQQLRDGGKRGIYVFAWEPGVIKYSQSKPRDVSVYCYVSAAGRVWLLMREE